MSKYAIKDGSTCPASFIPCPTKNKKELEQCIEVKKDIKKHPQYSALMDKYARKTTDTCPSSYKPCPADNKEAIEKCNVR